MGDQGPHLLVSLLPFKLVGLVPAWLHAQSANLLLPCTRLRTHRHLTACCPLSVLQAVGSGGTQTSYSCRNGNRVVSR